MGGHLIPYKFLGRIKSGESWMTSEIILTCFPAWVSKMQALMAAASFGQTKIPRGNGSYSVGCTDLMFNYTNKVMF